MDKFLVTITMINKDGKTSEAKVIETDKIGVSRTIVNFKPIKNYEIVEYLVTPFKTLI